MLVVLFLNGKEWRQTDNKKNFGFCKYANAEGALRSLRLLNGHMLGDDELHLKVDQNTTEYLAEYERKKEKFIEKEQEKEDFGSTEMSLPSAFFDTEAGDKTAKETIESITNSVLKALNEDGGTREGIVSKEVRAYREKQAKIEREKKDREEEIERRRKKKEEEEKREQRRQFEREEKEFKAKERSWIDHERDRDDARKDYFEELKEKQIKRKQLMLVDDEDEKPSRKKIKSRDAKKKRYREREQDECDRIKEKQELELLRREMEIREQEEERQRIAMEQERQEAEKEAQLKAEKLKGQFKAEEFISPGKLSDEKKSNSFSVSINMGTIPKKPATSTTPSKPIFILETDDSQETNLKKKRKLMVLEHEVGKHEGREEKEEKEKEDLTVILDAKAKAQAVIDKIPTVKSELFKFEINWDSVSENKIVEEKMRPWVKKKIIEYLGEEEQTLIDYICKKLTEHTPPDQLLELLLLVLEDEASDFVIRMWRMLIYNILMIQNEK